MPQLGESIAEATVVNLLVKVGDMIKTDQDIIEVETSKATMNVASPCPGCVEKLLVKLNESYPVGAVLGYLEATQADASRDVAARRGSARHPPGALHAGDRVYLAGESLAHVPPGEGTLTTDDPRRTLARRVLLSAAGRRP